MTRLKKCGIYEIPHFFYSACFLKETFSLQKETMRERENCQAIDADFFSTEKKYCRLTVEGATHYFFKGAKSVCTSATRRVWGAGQRPEERSGLNGKR